MRTEPRHDAASFIWPPGWRRPVVIPFRFTPGPFFR